MRGVWLRNLFFDTLTNRLSPKDALTLMFARIKPKPTSFYLKGVNFEQVDPVFWGVLVDVYVNRVYMPNGMELTRNNIIIDLGAHRGAFTSFAALTGGSTVYAYEPHPGNFKSLVHLLTANQLKNVTAHNVAIGGETGEARLYLSSSSSRHNVLGHDLVSGDPLHESINVSMLSLDDCLKDLTEVDFLKIDCEGAETEILLNAGASTMNKIRYLAAELHNFPKAEEVQRLQRYLSQFFPIVKIVPQGKKNLGYLYARR